MARQSVLKEKPDTVRPADSGFLHSVPQPVWLAPPAVQSRSFEFFDITRPHFYVIHGVPMAFVAPGEVR
jgi:hypothetical protein